MSAQLPLWFHRASTALVVALELIIPIGIVIGGRWRWLAAVVLIALQALIALTGNYAFFNLLTIALCTMLFDDRSLRMVAVPRQARWEDVRRWRSVATAAAIAIAPLPVASWQARSGSRCRWFAPFFTPLARFAASICTGSLP